MHLHQRRSKCHIGITEIKYEPHRCTVNTCSVNERATIRGSEQEVSDARRDRRELVGCSAKAQPARVAVRTAAFLVVL
jgi:hypothetical protein